MFSNDILAGMLIHPIKFETVDQTGRKDDSSKPKYAVDGNNATCAVTEDRDNPYWNGTFSKTVVVTSVTLSNVGAGKCTFCPPRQ